MCEDGQVVDTSIKEMVGFSGHQGRLTIGHHSKVYMFGKILRCLPNTHPVCLPGFFEGVFEVGFGDVFAGGRLDAFDARIVVHLQNIFFSFWCNQDINAANS